MAMRPADNLIGVECTEDDRTDGVSRRIMRYGVDHTVIVAQFEVTVAVT